MGSANMWKCSKEFFWKNYCGNPEIPHVHTVQHETMPPFEVSLGNSKFEHQTEGNQQWRKFNAEINYLGVLKLGVR